MNDTSVKVAVRVRPQSAKERIDMCQTCTTVTFGEPQIVLGKDKAFTFDYVFDIGSNQSEIYSACVHDLIEGTFDGYNATVFAYGQTGSGKTYTMGTGFDINVDLEQLGIIPRAVSHLFQGIDERRSRAVDAGLSPPDFKVNAQFIELYNEEILDLLDTTRDPSDKGRNKSHIRIHEDAIGSIYTVGITTRPVSSLDDNLPESGDNDATNTDSITTDLEMLTAKFHFVDLAGSERLKRTGATGSRAKEGISINCGLLALGNVISALGDKSKKGSHVPYRDSKLTRLLQDSLGGNSRTIMIACISPSDCDFMETLNALKYANRARDIKNKVTVNQDKTSRQISELRMEILALQAELLEYKMGRGNNESAGLLQSDLVTENGFLQSEMKELRLRLKANQETLDSVTARNIQLLTETHSLSPGDQDNEKQNIQAYIKENELMRVRLIEAESLLHMMRHSGGSTAALMLRTLPARGAARLSSSSVNDFNTSPEDHTQGVIDAAYHDLKRLRHKANHLARKSVDESDTETKNDLLCDVEEHHAHVGNGEDSKLDDDEDDNSEDYDDDESILSEDDYENGNERSILQGDLASLTRKISTKQRLIEELELSNRRAAAMAKHYEDKVSSLTQKIRDIEMERDTVLANLGTAESQSQEVVTRVRSDYEKKLSNLEVELKKLEAVKTEHAKKLKNQGQYEKQCRDLQRSLSEMKKQKVQLMNKIQEEGLKGRQLELEHSREISQLRKEQRIKDTTIKTLEAEKRQKELILKRKQEEVESLRRNQKPSMSMKAAGRTGNYDRAVTVPVSPISKYPKKFNTRSYKATWNKLENSLNTLVNKKQTIARMEKDMDRWIKQRESLSKKMDRFVRRKEKLKAMGTPEDDQALKELDAQLSNLHDNVVFTQDNINEIQTNIVQFEESKSWSDDELDPANLVCRCSLNEVKFMLSECFDVIVNKGLYAAEKELENKELLAKLHQERSESQVQRQLLQHLIKTQASLQALDDPSISQVMEAADSTRDEDDPSDSDISEDSSETTSPFDTLLKERISGLAGNLTVSSEGSGLLSMSELRRDKARRKTTTPEDLLFAANTDSCKSIGSHLGQLAETDGTAVTTLPDTFPVARPHSANTVARPNSLSYKTDVSTQSLASKKSPCNKHNNQLVTDQVPVSKALSTSASSADSLSSLVRSGSISEATNLSSANIDPTPPVSPSLNRRGNSSSNVFNRLTSRLQQSTPHTGRGVISMAPLGKSTQSLSFPLSHCSTAIGHAKAVLSVFATEKVLISGSKDRTCKLWDLESNEEMLTLDGHPNNVISVKYVDRTNILYTVSAHIVKLWDMRRGNTCVKTLTSGGQTIDGCATGNNNVPRLMTCPAGESFISDIVVDSKGSILYTAASNTVRIWDIRMFKAHGKLSGGHQAAIMTLAIDDTDTADGNICIVTGSKDHYIKVFELSADSSGIVNPKFTLDPPHYDGIQSLCLMGDLLFSGSRDTCIKKWDLAEQQMKHSITGAHKDWVCGLTLIPSSNYLVSGCRSGSLKVWNVDNCAQVGELQVPNTTVNAISANSQLVFSASDDGAVRCWKSRNNESPLDNDADD